MARRARASGPAVMPQRPATRCPVAAARNRASPRWPCGCRTGTGTVRAATAATRLVTRTRSARTTRPSSSRITAPGAGTGDFRATPEAGYPDVPVTGDYRRTGPQPADYTDSSYPGEASSGSYPRGGRPGGYPAEPGYPAGADYPEGYRGSSGSHRRDARPGRWRIPGRTTRGLPRRIVRQPPARLGWLPRRPGLPGGPGLSRLFAPAGQCGLSRRAAHWRIRRLSSRPRLWPARGRLGGRHC